MSEKRYAKASAFIDENVAERAYIAEDPGIYPEFHFSFVPCLPTERAKVVQDLDGKNEVEVCERWCEELSKRVRAWSLKPTPNLASFNRIKYKLLNKMAAIVIYGMEPGDPHETFYDDFQKCAKGGDGVYQDNVQAAREGN